MIKNKKALLSLLIIICVLSLSGQSFIKQIKSCKRNLMTRDKGNLDSMDNCYIGKLFPDLDLITIQGEKINIKDLRGKVILLNIWSTSCGPCIAEIPGLNDLESKYHNSNVAFISLLHESKETYKKFIAKGKNFSFKVVPRSKRIYYKQLDFIGFPRNIVIDKNGIIRKLFTGGENSRKAPELVKQKLIPIIDSLLKEKNKGCIHKL